MPLIDEDGFVLGSFGVLDDEPRGFALAEQAVLGFQVRLVRSVWSLRWQVAWHRWDAGLLAAQGRTLEAVAAGLLLKSVLDEVASAVAGLRPARRPAAPARGEGAAGAVVGWLGGDEFVAVLLGVDSATVEAIGHGLAGVLLDEVEVGRWTVRVWTFIGPAMASPGTTLDEVLSLADRAMYGARERGHGVLHKVGARTSRHRARAGAGIWVWPVGWPPTRSCPDRR